MAETGPRRYNKHGILQMETGMKNKMVKAAALAVISALLLSGCGRTAAFEVQTDTKANEKSQSKDVLEHSIKTLTKVRRGAGLKAEQDQIKALGQRMEDYGYTVAYDPFDGVTREGGLPFSSQNLIARKTGTSGRNDGRILILSAHIDSAPQSFGALDDASGVAVLEAVAEKMAKIKTDTELWFCIFSGEEEGLLGSRHFVEGLTSEEKSQIIGDIQVDAVGSGTGSYAIKTVTGQTNPLAEALKKGAAKELDERVPLTQGKGSSHVSFAIGGLPSALLTQEPAGEKVGTVLDRSDSLDQKALQAAAKITEDAVKSLVGQDSNVSNSASESVDSANGNLEAVSPAASQATSPQEREGDGIDLNTVNPDGAGNQELNVGYVSPNNERFGEETDLAGMERNLGVSLGEKAPDSRPDREVYNALIYWANLDTPLPTRLEFQVGADGSRSFSKAFIFAQERGYSADRIRTVLQNAYGQPDPSYTRNGAAAVYHFPDQLTRADHTLTVQMDGTYLWQVGVYRLGVKELDQYGFDEEKNPHGELPEEEAYIWQELISKVVSTENRSLMGSFGFFRDGLDGKRSYTLPATAQYPAPRVMIDPDDVLDRDGNFRDLSRSVADVTRELGHILSTNADQLAINAQGRRGLSTAEYLPDSYQAQFMKQFYPELSYTNPIGATYEDLRNRPEDFVSAEAAKGANEEFADAFTAFVFSDKPKGDSIWEQKILFFYGDPVFTDARKYIRGNFDWIK